MEAGIDEAQQLEVHTQEHENSKICTYITTNIRLMIINVMHLLHDECSPGDQGSGSRSPKQMMVSVNPASVLLAHTTDALAFTCNDRLTFEALDVETIIFM
jgi:hypothetical protein